MPRGRGLELKHMNFWNSYILELQHLAVYANHLKNKRLFNCELLLLSPCEYLNFIFCSLSLPQNGEDSGQRGIFIVYMTYHPPKVMASKSKLVWSHIFCGSGDLGQLGWVPLSHDHQSWTGKRVSSKFSAHVAPGRPRVHTGCGPKRSLRWRPLVALKGNSHAGIQLPSNPGHTRTHHPR